MSVLFAQFYLVLEYASLIVQANLSNPATSVIEENGQIRQVVRIDRLEKYMDLNF